MTSLKPTKNIKSLRNGRKPINNIIVQDLIDNSDLEENTSSGNV